MFSHSVMSNSLWPPGTAASQASLCFTISQSLLKLIFDLSQHQAISNELALWIRWPKYWSFSFSISPSNEYSGLISFRIDWFDLLAAQGTVKSLLQHHSSKASIVRHSTFFFIVQLSHPYITIWIFEGKVISLLFNMLSLSLLFFQEATVFQFHGCSHCPGWFWSPRK